jgi:mono/diheme cytochrome c family protein
MAKVSRVIKGAVGLATGLWLVGPTVRTAQADDAKPIYEKSCNTCHGPSGKGDGPAGKMLKPPPADLGTVLKGKADADIAKVIKEGGKAVGKSAAMPSFGGKLSDDQVKAIVEYVKGFASK